ncbi:hypothetical protein [Ilumatobacter sp.]|uniref:hypothetical protein n=1 Tax=Ilumatobacter sp. TaxID=1967498 RepID=UPI003B52FCD4
MTAAIALVAAAAVAAGPGPTLASASPAPAHEAPPTDVAPVATTTAPTTSRSTPPTTPRSTPPTTVRTSTPPPSAGPTTTATSTSTTAPTTVAPRPTATTAPPRTAVVTTPSTTATVVANPPPATTTPPAPAPTGPAAPPQRNIQVRSDQMEQILATIRYQESRGLYGIGLNKGRASGAYQFITSTWNGYGGYPEAYLAPPHVQDERAAADVQMFLDRYDGDVSMVPVMWYYPAAASNHRLMDIVPVPQAGNVLTVREYQSRWLATFSSISGRPIAPRPAPADLSAFAGLAPELPDAHEGAFPASFPVIGPSRMAVPDCDAVEADPVAQDASDDLVVPGVVESDGPSRADVEAAGLCTEQAPAIVFGVKLQPVLAIADGTVTEVRDRPGSGEPISVTVTDPTGTSHVYAGFNDDNPGTDDAAAPPHLRLAGLARVGQVVRAGQLLGFMGDTDPLPIGVRADDIPTDDTVEIDPEAVAPHIRISLLDVDGTPLDAFGPVVDALFRQHCRVMIGHWSSVANGTGHEEVVVETTDDDRTVDSQWTITSTGEVLASGWASLVNAGPGCPHTPDTTYGPGEDGARKGPLRWLRSADLTTDLWVSLALRDDDTEVPAVVHR